MSHDHGDDAHPYMGHHWETPQQQFGAAKLGMWLFMAQEVLFFSGLFCFYAVLRMNNPEAFEYGHQFLDKFWGAFNTVVLLVSSLTMAWAVRAAQLGQRKLLMVLLALTFLCACGFMVIKTVEYSSKADHGTLWGRAFDWTEVIEHEASASATDLRGDQSWIESSTAAAKLDPETADILPPHVSPEGVRAELHDESGGGHGSARKGLPPPSVHLFFTAYFCLTALHGIHVLVGMGLIAWMFVNAYRGKYNKKYFTQVDLVGLYWHLVDLIWIFLFPLLYLIS